LGQRTFINKKKNNSEIGDIIYPEKVFWFRNHYHLRQKGMAGEYRYFKSEVSISLNYYCDKY